jgi:hypothetical protein
MIYEWQFIGDDQWIFGEKIRGLVRRRIAEVYFDEDLDDPRGGWVWMTWSTEAKRGNSYTLEEAVECCESELLSISEG